MSAEEIALLLLLIAAVLVLLGYRHMWKPVIHCPHDRVRKIHGDEINFVGGYRFQCQDCYTYFLNVMEREWH